MKTADRRHATTFTTPSDLEIVAVRTFEAPSRLVWNAFTMPEHVSKWMLGPDGWTMPVCEIDLRPGGKWHWVWRKDDGSEMAMTGVYLDVNPPDRLVNTENWGAEWPETTVTTTFSEENGRTTVTARVRYPSKEARDAAMKTGMEDGWATSYARLDEYLERVA